MTSMTRVDVHWYAKGRVEYFNDFVTPLDAKYVHTCICEILECIDADVPLMGLCVPLSKELPLPLTPNTLTVGVLLLLPGEVVELGDEGLMAIKFGICDTFNTVGAFGSVGALASKGVGGDDLPAMLSMGKSMMCTLPGCVTLGA